MGLTTKPLGKLKGMLHKIEIEELKKKEEMNHAKSKPKKEETD